ncbi:sortase [Candidatus Peregrinibacteria bacterium]|nr:sortase [Candidatus Peregrinibacteria bacterium]
MSDYKFGSENGRSKKIEVKPEHETHHVSFDLGKKNSVEFSDKAKNHNKDHRSTPIGNKQKKKNKKSFLKIPNKVWNLLEWLTTSAIIFLVFFVAINFASYRALFDAKVEQISGQANNNPYTEQQIEKVRRSAPDQQKPLPIVHQQTTAQKQIPDLNLSVLPPDDRVIIPRINKNVPIVRVSTEKLIQRDWTGLEEQIQDALRHGVVHFPGTALPGQSGNVVVTGHSSYFPWDPGRFKDVFALLHQVSIGDEVVVYHNQQEYKYLVYDKKVVSPDQVEVLTQKGEERLTLITCTPVGTDINRLIVLARPV